jgi:hypothetical protein
MEILNGKEDVVGKEEGEEFYRVGQQKKREKVYDRSYQP